MDVRENHSKGQRANKNQLLHNRNIHPTHYYESTTGQFSFDKQNDLQILSFFWSEIKPVMGVCTKQHYSRVLAEGGRTPLGEQCHCSFLMGQRKLVFVFTREVAVLQLQVS